MRFPASYPLKVCLCLAPFPRYYHLVPKIQRRHVTLNTSHWEVICHGKPIYPTVPKILSIFQNLRAKWRLKSLSYKSVIDKKYQKNRSLSSPAACDVHAPPNVHSDRGRPYHSSTSKCVRIPCTVLSYGAQICGKSTPKFERHNSETLWLNPPRI